MTEAGHPGTPAATPSDPDAATQTTEADSPDHRGHVLRIPAFRYLWLNNLAYFIASNAQRFVFGWFVLDGLNRSERDQGLIVFALGLPSIFLVLHAGAWADRLDRRKMMISTQLASTLAMAAAVLLITADNASFGALLVLSLVAGSAAAVGQPVRQSLIPAVVPREQLYSAIAMNAIAMTLSLISGAAVARLFGNFWGFPGAFGFMLALFVLGLLALVPLRVPPHPEQVAPRSVRTETLEAVRFIYSNHALRKLFGLLTFAGLTINPLVMVTMQAHVKEGLGHNSGNAALPFAMMGVGIAITSVILMRKGNLANKGAAFMRAMLFGCVMTTLMGRTTALWQLAVLAFFMGLGGGFYINMNQGLIQSNTPQPLMGRVMGVYTLVQFGLLPLGALFYGFAAQKIGPGDTISIAAGLALLAMAAVYVSDVELRSLD